MSKQLVVLIREDPSHTHRASEAIRIALGLSTGNSTLSIILLNEARLLITDDAYDLPDGEILEKYLPVIKSLEIPITIATGSQDSFSIDEEFSVQESPIHEIINVVEKADAVLTF